MSSGEPAGVLEQPARHSCLNINVMECLRALGIARWKTALSTVVVAALQVSIALPTAIACECGPTPPPCQAYWQSPLVFLGTVTEVLATPDGRVARARMRIDRSYKGVSEPTLILFDDGMCDGPEMRLGEQFLMYTYRNGDGEVPARGCTRSRHVRYAEEDLKYLDGLNEAHPTGSVFGQVGIWRDGPGDDHPATGATVEIRGPDETSTTTTDSKGHYTFDGLKPAKYTVRASLAGFRMPTFEQEGVSASVEARGCAVINVTLRKHWPSTIEGRLIRSDGTPATAGIDLRLIRLGKRKNEDSQPLFAEDLTTNDQGEYAFRGVAPGRYKVVMHPCCFPTPEAPYPTIYWPGTSREASASEIEIGDSAVSHHYDFHLPPEVHSDLIGGVVLLPNGKPAVGARVQILKLPENAITGNDVTADAAGHFSFTALEGLEYSLSAITTGEPRLDSEAVNVSLGKGPRSITLVLNAP
jgi:hypothetical protein